MEPWPDPAIDALLSRLRACRWMQPDAALDALDADAFAWLEERVDEISAALSALSAAGELRLRLRTTRSARDACTQWATAWSAPADDPALRALAEMSEQCVEHLDRTLGNEARLRLDAAVREAARESLAASTAWCELLTRHEAAMRAQGEYVMSLEGERHPAAFVAAQQVRWELAFGDDPVTPSPWRPWWAMFERGAWPTLLPGATMLVFVPTLREGALVAEPSLGTRRAGRFPVRLAVPSTMRAMYPSLHELGASTPPSLPPPDPEGFTRGMILAVSTEPPTRWFR